jgi:hypothetical protein
MARFSDLFIYEGKTVSENVVTYHNCYLIKSIGHKHASERVETIVFDMEGMALLIPVGTGMLGPYCLSIF